MAEDAPIYDLMLLLSTAVEEERRAKVLADVDKAIASGGGSIVYNGDWGTRSLTYRIQHQGDAEYHLLQFTGPPALIESLKHSLGITDGVLRFRVIRVLPGTPPPRTPTPAPAMAAASASARAPVASAAAPPDEEASALAGESPTPSGESEEAEAGGAEPKTAEAGGAEPEGAEPEAPTDADA
jgi:small subunit ribosomal protein S6